MSKVSLNMNGMVFEAASIQEFSAFFDTIADKAQDRAKVETRGKESAILACEISCNRNAAKVLRSLAISLDEQALSASLKEMLDCYWGEGDGNPPPDFILRAQALIKAQA